MNDDLELRHLRYFVAVAEDLHFGRAAEKLHLSQPPLSQQIRRLEEIVGYALFERTSRSVKLTDAGECLLERARRVLRNVKRDLEETRSVGQGEVGSLHVGFVGSAMLTGLPEVFRQFREAHPRVRLHLYESFTARVLEGLQDGTLDVGIVRDGDVGDKLSKRLLFSEPYVAVLPATHPCAKRKSISPEILRGEPFVYYPRSAGARAFDKPLLIFEEYGFRPQIVQEASHWLTIVRLVGAGLGVSIAPACVRRIVSREVVCLPLRNVKVVSDLEVASLEADARLIVANFVEMARIGSGKKARPL